MEDPQSVLQRVCAFAEIPFHGAMERYFETAALRLDEHRDRRKEDGSLLISKEQRIDMQRLATRPPDPSRLFRWRRDMPPSARAEFEAVAGDLLGDLGYEVAGRRARGLGPRLRAILGRRRTRATTGSASDP